MLNLLFQQFPGFKKSRPLPSGGKVCSMILSSLINLKFPGLYRLFRATSGSISKDGLERVQGNAGEGYPAVLCQKLEERKM